jgi:DNA-binding MarR family transcriptional regulator
MATAEVAKTKTPVEINVADFSSLITGMSRLLSGLAAIGPFKEASLGLAEWVALTVLAEGDGVSNKQLARRLGVTGQRANQLGASLSKAGLISIAQSAQDSRTNDIKITDSGKAQLDTVNSQLKPLLASALNNNGRSLLTAAKQMRLLMRIVQGGGSEEQKKHKKEKKEKKREKKTAAAPAAGGEAA